MKVVGKFKDECKGQLMLGIAGLCPKLYSFDYEREAHFNCGEEVGKPAGTSVMRLVLDNKVTAKGVKVSIAKKVSFGDYEYCLNTLLPKHIEIRRIGSNLHKVFTYSTENIGCLLLTVKDGYAMMVFRRMHLDTGKRWLSRGSGQIPDHSIEGDGLLYLWEKYK